MFIFNEFTWYAQSIYAFAQELLTSAYRENSNSSMWDKKFAVLMQFSSVFAVRKHQDWLRRRRLNCLQVAIFAQFRDCKPSCVVNPLCNYQTTGEWFIEFFCILRRLWTTGAPYHSLTSTERLMMPLLLIIKNVFLTALRCPFIVLVAVPSWFSADVIARWLFFGFRW